MKVPGVPFVQGRNAYPDRDGRKYGIAIHCTANTAPARGEAGYATRRTDGVSAHIYADDTEVIQSLDTDARAGHAGSAIGNDNAVAVEITGLVTWSRQRWLDSVAWGELASVLAVLCREYDIDPRRATVAEMRADPRVRAFYGHDDMRRAWGGTTHTDPGPGFPWDHLLTKVQQVLAGEDDIMAALTDAEQRELLATVRSIKHLTSVAGYRVEALVSARPTYDNQMGDKAAPNRLAQQVAALGQAIALESSSPAEVRALLGELPAPPDAADIAGEVLDGIGSRPAADVAQALVAAGQDPAALAAALTALAGPQGQARE